MFPESEQQTTTGSVVTVHFSDMQRWKISHPTTTPNERLVISAARSNNRNMPKLINNSSVLAQNARPQESKINDKERIMVNKRRKKHILLHDVAFVDRSTV